MERKEINELDEMYQYHAPTAEEVVVMKEISVLAHVLSKKIADAVKGRPHTLAGDLKCQSLLGIKSAVMQSNAALIVGRAVRDKEKANDPSPVSADDLMRVDLRRATNALEILAGSRAPQNFASDVRGVESAGEDQVIVKRPPTGGASNRAASQRELEKHLNTQYPSLVIKVRRRKSR